MVKVIGWILGILSIGFVGMFFEKGEVLAGIISFFAIGFLIPPILNKINANNKKTAEEKGKTDKPLTQKSANIFGVVLIIIAAVIGSDSNISEEGESEYQSEKPKAAMPSWYESGNSGLIDKRAAEWHKATYKQQVSVSADYIAHLKQKGRLNATITANINTKEDVKPFAVALTESMNIGLKDSPHKTGQNPRISEAMATLIVTSGWAK